MKDWIIAKTWKIIEEYRRAKQIRHAAKTEAKRIRTADTYNELNNKVKAGKTKQLVMAEQRQQPNNEI